MSGGSFNYLYLQPDIKEGMYNSKDMTDMIKSFEVNGFTEIALDLKAFNERYNDLEREWNKFAALLHAMEWYCSHDADINEVKEQYDKYLEKKK